jgi:hypothetical protein
MRILPFLLALVLVIIGISPTQAGTQYSVTVTRRDSNFYEIDSTGLFLETSMCLELSLMQNAVLDVQRTGSTSAGIIYFNQIYGKPTTCSFMATYAKQSIRTRAINSYGGYVEISAIFVPQPIR